MSLVALDMAKSHLRVTWASEDQLIGLYLAAAEGAAASFLNRQIYATQADMDAAVLAGTAGDDPMVANMQIQAAILLILGHLYSNRENTVVGATVAELPQGAHDMLWPHRVGLGV
ncbi:gp6-like head-tail connector protein [Cupriavidus alkaliphilus]|uniref:head-tail connector protein n=1 Tax=Cupriavidus alkaliphilus TaxID=942866 RepID=UPI000DE6EB26|nr:head-tail connector protein [Cupriavidus alkaliphilus]PVY81061.1 gp6-like head-tail connector protein [Cupriavidus alkaliphilus]